MGAIEDLAMALIGADTQKAIQAENPYAGFTSGADQFSNLITQAAGSGKYSTKDILAPALLSGLTSGIFRGLGDRYTADLSERYKKSALGMATDEEADLPPSLMTRANDARGIFKLRSALAQQEADRESERQIAVDAAKNKADVEKELIKVIATSGKQTQRDRATSLLAQLQQKDLQDPQEMQRKSSISNLVQRATDTEEPSLDAPTEIVSPSIAAAQSAPVEREDSFIQKTIKSPTDRLAELTQQFGGDEDLAAQAFRDELQNENKAKQEQSKKDREDLVAMQSSVNQSGQALAQLKQALDTAGSTGGVFGWDALREQKLLAQEQLDDPEASKILAGRKLLDNSAVMAAAEIRKLFPGSVAASEMQMYFKGGPASSSSPAQNRAIYEKLNKAYQLASKKKVFLEDAVLRKGMSLAEANASFDAQYPLDTFLNTPTEQQTLGVTEPQSAASATPQAEKPATDSFFSGVGDTARAAGRGLLKIPETTMAIFKPSTYKEGFKDAETSARTVGKGAAITAGAVAGGTYGLAGGPIGSAIGAGLGALAGYLGFDATEEAASEAAGVGTEKSVIPSKAEFDKAVEDTVAGLGAGKVLKTTGTALGAPGRAAARLGEKVKEESVGVTPTAIKKSLEAGKIEYFDDAGNKVPIADASVYKAGIQKSVETLQKDGFFDNLSNDVKTNKLAVDKKIQSTGQAIGDLHKEAAANLVKAHAGLSKIQQRQYPIRRVPGTDKGGYQPNLIPAWRTIAEVAKHDSRQAAILKGRLNRVIAKWDKTDRSYLRLGSYKTTFGKNTKFNQSTEAVEQAWNAVKKDIYNAFNKKQIEAFDAIMSKVDPSKVGALAEANALHHAYRNINPLMIAKSTKVPTRLLSPVGTIEKATEFPSRLAGKFPGTSLKATGVISAPNSAMNMLLNTKAGRGLLGLGSPDVRRGIGINAMLSEKAASSGQKKNDKIIEQVLAQSSSPSPTPSAKPTPIFMAKASVPESLVKAVIAQESGGKAHVVSDAGAQGLMQLLPATGKELAARVGVKYDPFDAEQNKQLGTLYLSDLLKKYDGDIELALTAYHTGMGNVDKYLKEEGGTTLADIQHRLGPVGKKYAKEVLGRIKDKSILV